MKNLQNYHHVSSNTLLICYSVFVCLQAQFGDDYYDVDEDADVKPVFNDSGDEFDEGQCMCVSYLGLFMIKPFFGVRTGSHTNRALQPQKMVIGLKFQIWEGENGYRLEISDLERRGIVQSM